MSNHRTQGITLLALIAMSCAVAACASTRPARDADAFVSLTRATLPQDGLTRAILAAVGNAASDGAVALVMDGVGKDKGYDQTWAAGNRYYDQAAKLVERDMAPMLSRLDPTALLERNLTRALQRHLTRHEAAQLVQTLAQPEGRRFTEYTDAVMAQGILLGVAAKTPEEFRSFMVLRLEPLRPRLEAAATQAQLTDDERAWMTAFAGSALGRKLGRAYRAWAESLRGEWTADLLPRTREVRENLLRSADDLRAILREYEQWRSGALRDAGLGEPAGGGA